MSNPQPQKTEQNKDQRLAPVAQMQQYLATRAQKLGEWVVGHTSPTALIRFALMEMSQSPQLQKASRESIYLALIACAQLGLEPSGVKGEAYIVPFNTKRNNQWTTIATFVPGYRGLIKLAYRSGAIQKLASNVVYANDVFDIDLGSESRLIHKPAFKDRGELVGAYAFAKMGDELIVEWMSRDDLERVRASAMKGDKESPAYRDWDDQMYRKAPIRRLAKRLPLGDDFAKAAAIDGLVEAGKFRQYQQVIDVEGEDLPELADEEPAEPPPATVAEAKEKLRARAGDKSGPPPQQPPPAPPAAADASPKDEGPDEYGVECDAIKAEIELVLDEPIRIPGLRERIGRLKAKEAKKLGALLSLMEEKAAKRQASDDVPDLSPGKE